MAKRESRTILQEQAFIVATCSLAIVTSAVSVNECSSGPVPISVTVNIVNNSLVNLTTEFIAVSNAETLTSVIDIRLNDTSILTKDDSTVCSNLEEGSCPLTIGETIKTSFSLPLVSVAPLTDNLEVQFSIRDENNVVQECFSVPAEIADSILKRSRRSLIIVHHRNG